MLDRGYRNAIIDSFEIIKFILADRGYRFMQVDSFRCMKAFTKIKVTIISTTIKNILYDPDVRF